MNIKKIVSLKINNSIDIKTILFALFVLVAIALPVFTFAQATGGGGSTVIPIRINNPFNCGTAGAGNCTLMTLITSILNGIVMPIAAVAVTVWIVWAGFGFVMAQGKPAEIEKAKQRLLWSLIGAGILLGAVGISTVVSNTVRALIVP